MLDCLEGSGHIVGLDVDPEESAKTEERLRNAGYGEDILSVRLTNFSEIDRIAAEFGRFDFILADLGVSSMQIDNPERGFSYKTDGPLDLRMNQSQGMSAAERLLTLSKDELIGMFTENSDEPYAREIADEIFARIKKGMKIETTTALREAVETALSGLPHNEQKDAVAKSCKRVFQALRIDVNSEFEVLYAFLSKLPDVMNPGGRIAVLTFHSGEDRLVKKSFKELYRAGVYSEISDEAVRPTAEECARNSRARSTKFRYAVVAGEK